MDHRIIHSPLATYAMAVYTVYKMRDTRFAEREARHSTEMNGTVAAANNPKSPNVDVSEHNVTALAGHQKDEKELLSLEDKQNVSAKNFIIHNDANQIKHETFQQVDSFSSSSSFLYVCSMVLDTSVQDTAIQQWRIPKQRLLTSSLSQSTARIFFA